MPEPIADVVPLCRALRRENLPDVYCPHCVVPLEDGERAIVLRLPLPHRISDRDVLAGEL